MNLHKCGSWIFIEVPICRSAGKMPALLLRTFPSYEICRNSYKTLSSGCPV